MTVSEVERWWLDTLSCGHLMLAALPSEMDRQNRIGEHRHCGECVEAGESPDRRLAFTSRTEAPL